MFNSSRADSSRATNHVPIKSFSMVNKQVKRATDVPAFKRAGTVDFVQAAMKHNVSSSDHLLVNTGSFKLKHQFSLGDFIQNQAAKSQGVMQQQQLKFFKANTSKPIKEVNIRKQDYLRRKTQFMHKNPLARATLSSTQTIEARMAEAMKKAIFDNKADGEKRSLNMLLSEPGLVRQNTILQNDEFSTLRSDTMQVKSNDTLSLSKDRQKGRYVRRSTSYEALDPVLNIEDVDQSSVSSRPENRTEDRLKR